MYIFFNMLLISLGFMQFGLGMNSFSPTSAAFAKMKGWSDDETTQYTNLIQSITIFGAAIGSLSCAKFLSIGKLRLILILNAVLVTGVTLAIVSKIIWLICIGRLIWGFAFGAFSVACAKMVNECTPVEYGGSFGAINQLSLCFGAAVPGTLALAEPADFSVVSIDDFYVQNYWRVIWAAGPYLASLI